MNAWEFVGKENRKRCLWVLVPRQNLILCPAWLPLAFSIHTRSLVMRNSLPCPTGSHCLGHTGISGTGETQSFSHQRLKALKRNLQIWRTGFPHACAESSVQCAEMVKNPGLYTKRLLLRFSLFFFVGNRFWLALWRKCFLFSFRVWFSQLNQILLILDVLSVEAAI